MSTLIKGKDFFVTNVTTDHYGYAGCETCDYGSSYTSEVTIEIVKDEKVGYVTVKASAMYHAPELSMSDIIVYFCKNYDKFEKKTLEQFIKDVSKTLFASTDGNFEVERSGSAKKAEK